MTIEPIRSLLAYCRFAFWISSSVKMALIETEIFPSLSHSNSCSKSGAKLFDRRFTPKNVVLFPQKYRLFANSLRTEGITERSGVPVQAGKFTPYPNNDELGSSIEFRHSLMLRRSSNDRSYGGEEYRNAVVLSLNNLPENVVNF